MSYIWTVITLRLIIMDQLFAMSPGDIKTFCEATTNAVAGQNASLRCEFEIDIIRLRSEIRVFHYKQIPEYVLRVLWLNGKPRVETKPGYELKGNITTFLVLEIPRVTEEHAGEYACRVLKSSVNASTPCNLSVLGVNYTTVSVESSQNFTDSNNTGSPEAGKLSVIFIVSIVFGIAVCITIALLIIWKRKQISKHFRNCCCLTPKIYIPTIDLSSQQQPAQEAESPVIPLCEDGDQYLKNTTC